METEHPAKFAPEVLLPSLGRGVDHVLVENTHLALSQVRRTDLVHWGTDQDNWHISIATHRPQFIPETGKGTADLFLLHLRFCVFWHGLINSVDKIESVPFEFLQKFRLAVANLLSIKPRLAVTIRFDELCFLRVEDFHHFQEKRVTNVYWHEVKKPPRVIGWRGLSDEQKFDVVRAIFIALAHANRIFSIALPWQSQPTQEKNAAAQHLSP